MGSSGINESTWGLQFPLSFGRHHNSKTWHSSDTQVLVWPATAGLVLEAGLPLWLSTGMGLSSAATERTGSTASARKRGLLRLSPRPGTDGGDTVEPPIAGGALVIGQNSVTPDYTPEQKGAAWGLNWGLVKRDAGSEADAYYGGAYTGYGYGGLGYGYGGLGYGYGGYGKRSADSEADAYYGYGG